jgi:dTDP-4-amino-4,6-dideoxygalactose transaminase
MNIHDITKQFEQAIADYTGAKYCICVDNASNGLYMALTYEGVKGLEISIPSHTYPSVPCEIINAGAKVIFEPSEEYLKGEYRLKPTNIWDSALRFTADMYQPDQIQVLSFTGPYKRLKTQKGGAILTDNYAAYLWFKRFRFSGRRECSYFEDHFDFIGRNYYMAPVIATMGLLQMPGFYNLDGTKKGFEDIEHKYPDLSQFPIYQR